MIYKAKSGIVLTTICDQYVLIASRTARNDSPFISEINETFADCWKELEKGTSFDELIQYMMTEYEIEDLEALKSDIHRFLTMLSEQGYVIEMKG